MRITIFEIHTENPPTKEDLSVIGISIKKLTDVLHLERTHLGNFVVCPDCGYRETEVNPVKTRKQQWKCRNCGALILESSNTSDSRTEEGKP